MKVALTTLLLSLLFLIVILNFNNNFISSSYLTNKNKVLLNYNNQNETIITSNNGNSGAKISISQNALNYMAHQFKPLIEQQIKNAKVDDIHQDVKTPIGKVKFDVTDVKLSNVAFSSPKLLVDKNGQDLHIQISDIGASLYCHWHYKKKHFPKLSDHGHANANLGVSVDVRLKINIKDATHFTAQVYDLNLSFNKFSIKLHGGASWLYNFFIKAFKGSIEKNVRKTLESQLPPAINQAVQKSLSSLVLIFPVGAPKYGVKVDFSLEQVDFGTTSTPSILTIGTAGKFEKTGSPAYPGQPSNLPNSVGDYMIQFLLSDYSLNSASHAFREAGVMTSVVKDKDIPSSIPFHLNTTYFKPIIPKLYAMYPNREMQINLTASADPTFKFTSNGIQLNAVASAIFEVLGNSTAPAPINVFSLDLHLSFDFNVKVVNNNVAGSIAYKNVTMSVSHSKVGDFSVKALDTSIRFIFQYVLVPIANQVTEKGFPLPTMKGLTLRDSKIIYQSDYFSVASNFDFNPGF